MVATQCNDTTDIQAYAFMNTVVGLTNDTSRVAMDFSMVQLLMKTVAERVGCRVGARCRCLKASAFVQRFTTLTPTSYERLSLLLMRYIYNPIGTCRVIKNLNNEATTLEFSHGWFSNRDFVDILIKTFGNLAKATRRIHDDDFGDDFRDKRDDHDEDGHFGDEGEGGRRPGMGGRPRGPPGSGIGGTPDDWEDLGIGGVPDDYDEMRPGLDDSDEIDLGVGADYDDYEGIDDSGDDNQIYYIFHNGCPHILCFDANVAVGLLYHLGITSEQDAISTIASLLIQGLIINTPFAIDCESVEAYINLPDESAFIGDAFARVGAGSPNRLSYGEFRRLQNQLGLGYNTHGNARGKRDTHFNITQCYSSAELFQAYSFHPDLGLSANQFATICPSLVQQMVSEGCVARQIDGQNIVAVSDTQKYGYGTLAAILICVSTLPGVFLHRYAVTTRLRYRLVKSLCVGLTIGALLTDSILHLVPTALEIDHASNGDNSNTNDRDYIGKGLLVIGAAVLIFILDSTINFIVRHSNSDAATEEDHYATPVDAQMTNVAKDGVVSFCQKITVQSWSVIAETVIQNVLFGLTVGAAFSHSILGGFSTTLAIMCYQLTRTFNKLLLLVDSKLTKGQASFLIIVSTLPCFIGLYVGIAISADEKSRTWILAFVAGVFLYIAIYYLVSEAHTLQHGERGFWTIIVQLLGLATGVGILLAIAVHTDI